MDMTIVFQLFFVCGMFLISLGALYLPRKALSKNAPTELSPRAFRILDLTNFFAVGVFLATCFVMLTPHVQSSFNAAFAQFKWSEEVSNKLVQLIIVLGFLLIFFLEKILDYCKRDSNNYSNRNNGGHFFEESEDEFVSKNRSTKKKYVVTFGESEEFEKTDDDVEVNREEIEQNADFSCNNNNNNDTTTTTTTQSATKPDVRGLEPEVKLKEENEEDNDEDDDQDESRRLVADSKSLDASSSLNDLGRNKKFKVKIRSANSAYQKRKKNVNSNNIKGILSNKRCDKMVVGQRDSHSRVSKGQFDVRCAAMLIALCVHSVFEGATLGLQTDPWQFLGLAAAVALHQAVAAVAVGISLARRYLKFCPFLVSALLFSAAIPVGVFIGILLSFLSGGGTQSSSTSTGSSTAKVVSACLQGLTVGTFVYVIFIEILPSETNKRKDQLFKAFLLIIGFTLVTVMAFFLAKT